MGKILETARQWLSLGVATIPVGWKTKQPTVKWLTYTERLPTENELNYWFATDMANIGIVTRWKNLCIIDFDDMDVFRKWYFWAMEKGGKAKETAMYARIHKSARGMHVYTLSDSAENLKLPKIDVLAHRKYALLPPSLHPSGVRYEIYRDAFPMPINSLYDVLPKVLLDDALNKKTTPQTTLSTPPPSVINTDPWKLAGMDIPQSQHVVDEIKRQIPITSILSGLEDSGGNGRWKITRCPFHDDKNPSFWVDTQKNLCGCHSGCTPLPLDVINLYARLNGIDNVQAIFELSKRLH